jgi:hypothetical protein
MPTADNPSEMVGGIRDANGLLSLERGSLSRNSARTSRTFVERRCLFTLLVSVTYGAEEESQLFHENCVKTSPSLKSDLSIFSAERCPLCEGLQTVAVQENLR